MLSLMWFRVTVTTGRRIVSWIFRLATWIHLPYTNFLTEDLGSSSEEINELSDLVWHKTAGSLFHIIQWIGSIRGDGLLSYDTTTFTKEFYIDEILQAKPDL